MSGEESSNAKRRRVARACDTCRRKKVRCDGVQAGSDPPSCTNCKAYGYECAFIDAPKKRGPPKGYIEALETRLQRMESILGGLVQSGELPEGAISPNLEWINVNETNFNGGETVVGKSGQESRGTRKSYEGGSKSSSSSGLSSAHRTDGYSRHKKTSAGYRSRSNSEDSDQSLSDNSNQEYGSNYDLNDSMGQLAIDETGQTRYLGNSSGIFLLKITNRVANGQIITVPRGDCHNKGSSKSAVFELPPRELCDQMLDTYFTRVHPYMPFLDPVELREKYENLSNNSSILMLLYAIFAISSRFIDQPAVRKNPDDPTTTGDGFFERAKELLKDEFDDAQLSTLQALLLMAAYQQGAKNSRTWIYTGLAIRIAQDMGLHRDSAKWSLDETQTEVRKRVWWSCYMSDRFISAGLGRPMNINESDCDVPFPTPGALPTDEPGSVDAWVRTIKLTQILGRVLSHIYGIKSKHTTHAAMDSVLATLDAELNKWRDDLPPELQYDPSITVGDPMNQRRGVMHLMFYTIQILLHRPHIRGPKSKAPPSSIPSLTICTMAANNITHIAYRAMKEGKLRLAWNFTLYFFFTASVMHVINALSGDDRFREVAKHGLRMSLKCLEHLKPYWFGSEKCILVIRDLLRVRNINLDGFNPNGTEHINKSKEDGEDPFKVDGNVVMCMRNDLGDGRSIPNSNHKVTFAPSSPSSSNISASTTQQQRSPSIPYENSPSPASSSSSTANTFIPVGSEFLNQENAFFPPNADAFATTDVSSLIFDDEDPLGNGNPFWSVPTNIDWNVWTEYVSGMHGLRATVSESNGILGRGVNTTGRMPHGL
ncbi:10174_t:CDS:2 [Ambispora gerdemannii]|uniref:10174_t:CDS:1 n=1 Tax=Ambispora gerdemannii TaxID=144530 RepID=A0A9N8YZV3_9GLOM|nr:10174_t:CDS:2 [Ambispora gerdemannii]